MKSIIASLLFVAVSFGQQLEFSQVVAVDNVSKNTLHKRAVSWVAGVFKSAKHVMQINDMETGEIVCKGNIDFYVDRFMCNAASGRVDFTLKIYSKDNRYKYIVTDIVHHARNEVYSVGPVPETGSVERLPEFTTRLTAIVVERIREDVNSGIVNGLIGSLKKAMVKQSEPEDDNW